MVYEGTSFYGDVGRGIAFNKNAISAIKSMDLEIRQAYFRKVNAMLAADDEKLKRQIILAQSSLMDETIAHRKIFTYRIGDIPGATTKTREGIDNLQKYMVGVAAFTNEVDVVGQGQLPVQEFCSLKAERSHRLHSTETTSGHGRRQPAAFKYRQVVLLSNIIGPEAQKQWGGRTCPFAETAHS